MLPENKARLLLVWRSHYWRLNDVSSKRALGKNMNKFHFPSSRLPVQIFLRLGDPCVLDSEGWYSVSVFVLVLPRYVAHIILGSDSRHSADSQVHPQPSAWPQADGRVRSSSQARNMEIRQSPSTMRKRKGDYNRNIATHRNKHRNIQQPKRAVHMTLGLHEVVMTPW